MLSFLVFILSLIIAITVHEFFHSFMADRLGDPTPRINGRLTLNPLAHLDPLGTLALVLFHFGWGKPVPIDPFNLRNPRRDTALISLSGPASNLILAVLLSFLFKFLPVIPLITQLLIYLITLNVSLAIFNLLPVPPLDGGSIVIGFLPLELAREWEEILNQYGPILLILLILPIGGQPLVTTFLMPIINLILHFLI